jgi:hypothetical protein
MSKAPFDKRFANSDNKYFVLSKDRQRITAIEDDNADEYPISFTESDFSHVSTSVTYEFEIIETENRGDWVAVGAAIPQLVTPYWDHIKEDHGAYLLGSNNYVGIHNDAPKTGDGFYFGKGDIIKITYNAIERTLLFERTTNGKLNSLKMTNVAPNARPCIILSTRGTIVEIK